VLIFVNVKTLIMLMFF